jgi:hypothetical protein
MGASTQHNDGACIPFMPFVIMMNVVAPSRELDSFELAAWLSLQSCIGSLPTCLTIPFLNLLEQVSLDWPKLLNARRGKALGCFIQCVSGEGK